MESSIALAILAVVPIYFGSIHSKKQKSEDKETISASQAWLFPVIGSVALLTLYLVIQYLDKDILNLLFKVYFTIANTFAVYQALPKRLGYARLPIVIAFIAYDFYQSTWITKNICALCLAYSFITIAQLDSFKTGFILLGGLFFYDIFWVFSTPVMVTVATKIDAPIKLLWPREQGFALLGLGDIVVPGVFVALCARFESPTRPGYFSISLIAYCVGLASAMIAVHIFQSPQPALLYLSPSCSLSVLMWSMKQGQVKDLFSFDEI